MDFRQTVLEEGMNIFRQHGIKSLNMETILGHLEISKGTLHGMARTKEELLVQCVDAALERKLNHFSVLIEVATSELEAILQLLHAQLKALAGLHPDYLSDLKNHYPACWQKTQHFASHNLHTHLSNLFSAGIKKQLFKPETDPQLISKLLIAQINAVAEAGLLQEPENNFNSVYKLGFELYVSALLTGKGQQVLEKVRTPKVGNSVPDLK